jgi:hypothetical protein
LLPLLVIDLILLSFDLIFLLDWDELVWLAWLSLLDYFYLLFHIFNNRFFLLILSWLLDLGFLIINTSRTSKGNFFLDL